MKFFRKVITTVEEKGLRGPDLSLLMRRETVDKFRNLLAGLEAGCLRVVQATATYGRHDD